MYHRGKKYNPDLKFFFCNLSLLCRGTLRESECSRCRGGRERGGGRQEQSRSLPHPAPPAPTGPALPGSLSPAPPAPAPQPSPSLSFSHPPLQSAQPSLWGLHQLLIWKDADWLEAIQHTPGQRALSELK